MPKTMQLRKENLGTVKISKGVSKLKVNLAAAHIMSTGHVFVIQEWMFGPLSNSLNKYDVFTYIR
jgi:hypothetical protein